jgi:hypothetical protein
MENGRFTKGKLRIAKKKIKELDRESAISCISWGAFLHKVKESQGKSDVSLILMRGERFGRDRAIAGGIDAISLSRANKSPESCWFPVQID